MPSTIPHLHHDTKLAIIIPYCTCILRQIYDARRWKYDGNSLSTHPSIEFRQNFPTAVSPIVDIYSPTRGNGFLLSTPPVALQLNYGLFRSIKYTAGHRSDFTYRYNNNIRPNFATNGRRIWVHITWYYCNIKMPTEKGSIWRILFWGWVIYDQCNNLSYM